MSQLLLIVIIAILVIFLIINSCQNQPQKEAYECINPNTNLIPKRILNFRNAVDTFNCNKPIPLGNSMKPQDYNAYKLTIKISRLSKFQNIENNVEYNICGGLIDMDKISWRLFLKLSPTTDYLLKDFRYDLYLQINNSNPIYIPSVSSVNNTPVRGSYETNRPYELTIYKTQNYCYLGAVETFSNNPNNRFPEFKMDLYNLYNSPTKKSDIKDIISSNRFFSSDAVPPPGKSIKIIGGSGSCILEPYSLEP
jgi:hypothetical protein